MPVPVPTLTTTTLPFPYFFMVFDAVFSNVILLKHPDVSAISEPAPMRGLERMDIRLGT